MKKVLNFVLLFEEDLPGVNRQWAMQKPSK